MSLPASPARVLAVVWLCAVALAVIAVVTLLRAHPEALPGGAAVDLSRSHPYGVIIGSSLVYYAFPPELRADGVFSDAKPGDRIVRLAGQGIVEPTQRAVAAGVRRIFVEIDPLLRAFKPDARPPYERAPRELSNRVRAAALNLFASTGDVTAATARRVYDGNASRLGAIYPLTLHDAYDADAIAQIVASARARNVDVVWVAMPRSQTAADYLGRDFERAFQQRLDAFSARFGARVWRPAAAWPNEYFIDQGHLNAAGRARFLSELQRFGSALDDL